MGLQSAAEHAIGKSHAFCQKLPEVSWLRDGCGNVQAIQ